jgi:hypothetical protein
MIGCWRLAVGDWPDHDACRMNHHRTYISSNATPPKRFSPASLPPKVTASIQPPTRAGEGNRTLTTSLEGWGSTIELHPRFENPNVETRMTKRANHLRRIIRHSDFVIRRSNWGVQDSNLRRHSHQIYSLAPLTARETPRFRFRPFVHQACPTVRGRPSYRQGIASPLATRRMPARLAQHELAEGLEPTTC